MKKYPENVNPDRRILVVGNPFDGMKVYGPFDGIGDAQDFAETFFEDEEWSIPCIEGVQCDENGYWIDPE